MSTCKYIYNDKVYNSYDSLVSALSEDDIEKALSILFSLNKDKQSEISDKISNINKTYNFAKNQTIIDGSPDIQVSSGFTTQTFIDSAYYVINGESPILRLNNEEFAEAMKDQMINIDNMSEEDAALTISKIQEKWDRIGKDSSDLHKILVSTTQNDDDRQISARTLNTAFTGVYDQIGKAVKQLEKNIWGRQKNATLHRNINLEADIRGIAEKITGHIDYLFVRPDGDIEIFNIKSSISNESDWSSAKVEKYKHQLALLKRILEYNGISAKNIRVNLVPVKIKYDQDFENVVEISVSDAVSYDTKDVKYTLQEYDNIAANFIASNATIDDLDDSVFDKVNMQLNKIFPNKDINIRANGIKESAKGWVKHNWRSITTPAKNGEKGWLIKFPGEKEPIKIDDTRIAEDNEELVNLVIDREEELFGDKAYEKGTYRVIADIQKSYEDGRNEFVSSSKGAISSLLVNQLSKYFKSNGYLADGKTPDYKWELVYNDTLSNANMVMFKHKVTDQVDVITLTPYDVSVMNKTNNRDHLLGAYLPNLNRENFTMQSNYGNIEAIRSLTLLNEVVPKLNFKAKLGQLKVLSLSPRKAKKGCEFEFSQLLPQFDTVIRVVNQHTNDKIDNNYKKENIEVIDPALLFIQTWKEVLHDYKHLSLTEVRSLDEYIKDKNTPTGTIDGLETLESTEGKIEKLELIVDKMKQLAIGVGVPLREDKLVSAMHSDNDTQAAIAKVYVAALRALSMYNGDLSIDNEEFSQMSEYFMKPQSIPNSNVRTVGYMFQKSINKIADTVLNKYAPIREIIMDYYKECSDGDLQKILGTKARLFKNLYAVDPITGEKTMQFKNPYDLSTDLEAHERKFLKKILWEFYKIRQDMHGTDIVYSGPEDSKLIEAINKGTVRNYFNAPLERASAATRRTNMKNAFKDFGNRWMRRIMKPKEAFMEFSEGILSDEDKQARDFDISNLQAYNPFSRSEDTNRRENYLRNKGVDYFETDVENLIIDYLEKHVQCSEYNKMLTRTKGILLDLQLRGIAEDDPKSIEHTVKTIEDFLSVSVYNKSIMEESSQKLEAYLQPIRRAVTKCYIAANPVAAVRDTMNGLLENTIRTLTKFQTDLDVKDVMAGYKEVITDAPNSIRTITKLNQLNVKYRFSNLDIARISEGLKSGRNGILNWENWAFSTLRGPDYLNRMVLFSARMHHDGVTDAYKMDDGKLVYDWTLDKRFDKYIKNDTSNMEEYSKQRSLYLSLLRIFNQENGTKLVEGDPLPDAYTLQQIETFKNFADNIYGAYNQSQKAKYENIAVGRNFAVFSTWMNGIVDVYAKERQLSRSESKWEQDTNPSGEPLYFDKHGNAVTLAEGGDVNTPVMKDVPIMVQGCWYTLKDTFKELYQGMKETDNFKDFQAYMDKNVFDNEINRRNWRRMWTDFLVAAILAAMFKAFITPAYQEHKAKGDGSQFITNAITEILYKASNNCYDGFRGPMAVLDYFGNSTNPATYKLSSKLLNDSYQLIFGDKTAMETLVNAQALPRSFKDSYTMWLRDNK